MRKVERSRVEVGGRSGGGRVGVGWRSGGGRDSRIIAGTLGTVSRIITRSNYQETSREIRKKMRKVERSRVEVGWRSGGGRVEVGWGS